MDAKTVEKQLEEVKARLRQIEEEREVLIRLVQGFEGWLRLHPPASQTSLPIAQVAAPPSISLQEAVLQVLKDAHGSPLHAREIYRRALDLGAVTNAKEPVNVTDLVAWQQAKKHPIEKTAGRTWRWAGNGTSNNV